MLVLAPAPPDNRPFKPTNPLQNEKRRSVARTDQLPDGRPTGSYQKKSVVAYG
jgi:hypothetical protein